MNKPAGYLINHKEGLAGEPGLIFDYIVAGNGLFVRCKNSLLEATICIAPAVVKGLPDLVEGFRLCHGLVPYHLYSIAENIFLTDAHRESYFAITWEDGSYHIRRPEQKREPGHVGYEVLPSTAIDMHSHGPIPAFFSSEDTRDEQGFRLSIVLGRLDTGQPEYTARVCCYGYFLPEISLQEVFVWKY